MANIYRVASIYGCKELESFGTGSAGIVGNLLSPIYIVMVGIFAFCFFGEEMTPLEICGAALIGGVVLANTAIKACRRLSDEEEDEEEEEEEDEEKLLEKCGAREVDPKD